MRGDPRDPGARLFQRRGGAGEGGEEALARNGMLGRNGNSGSPSGRGPEPEGTRPGVRGPDPGGGEKRAVPSRGAARRGAGRGRKGLSGPAPGRGLEMNSALQRRLNGGTEPWPGASGACGGREEAGWRPGSRPGRVPWSGSGKSLPVWPQAWGRGPVEGGPPEENRGGGLRRSPWFPGEPVPQRVGGTRGGAAVAPRSPRSSGRGERAPPLPGGLGGLLEGGLWKAVAQPGPGPWRVSAEAGGDRTGRRRGARSSRGTGSGWRTEVWREPWKESSGGAAGGVGDREGTWSTLGRAGRGGTPAGVPGGPPERVRRGGSRVLGREFRAGTRGRQPRRGGTGAVPREKNQKGKEESQLGWRRALHFDGTYRNDKGREEVLPGKPGRGEPEGFGEAESGGRVPA